MDELKKNKCVIEHKNIQPTIKYFNSLASNLMLYEMQQHKAWFDNVHTIYDKLAQPVLAKDPKTNQLIVNLHPAVFQLIRESKTMMKMNLGKLGIRPHRRNRILTPVPINLQTFHISAMWSCIVVIYL